jgi:hypothetical protein
MTCAFVSLATALAMSVLPVPGGPYNKTPRGGRTSVKPLSSELKCVNYLL